MACSILPCKVPKHLRKFTPCYLTQKGIKFAGWCASYTLGYAIGVCAAPVAICGGAVAGLMAAGICPEEEGGPGLVAGALYAAIGAGYVALGAIPQCVGMRTMEAGGQVYEAAWRALGFKPRPRRRRVIKPCNSSRSPSSFLQQGEYDPKHDCVWICVPKPTAREPLPFDPLYEYIRAPKHYDFGTNPQVEDKEADVTGCVLCEMGLR